MSVCELYLSTKKKHRQEVGEGGGIYFLFLNLDMNLRVHLPLKQTKKTSNCNKS